MMVNKFFVAAILQKRISGKKNGDEKKSNLCIVRIKKRFRNFKMTFLSYFL